MFWNKQRWKPVSVLTGFLGSGKTTVLKHLLSLPEMAGTALIINEFGEVSVDHLLVETPEEKMVLLANGCVCCSVRGDLVEAVRSLFERMRADEIPPFQRILLETTGVADPGPIVQSLIGPALKDHPVYFDSIATCVDSTNAFEAMPHNSQMATQIAVADSLLITKTDLSSKRAVEALRRDLARRNPRAEMELVEHGVAPSELVFGQRLLDPTARKREVKETVERVLRESSVPAHDGHGLGSFVFKRDRPVSYGTLQRFLRALTSYRSEDLLRVKGLVLVEGQESRPLVIHGVQSVMHPPQTLKSWPTKERSTQLVFITRGLAQSDVEQLWAGVEGGFASALR